VARACHCQTSGHEKQEEKKNIHHLRAAGTGWGCVGVQGRAMVCEWGAGMGRRARVVCTSEFEGSGRGRCVRVLSLC